MIGRRAVLGGGTLVAALGGTATARAPGLAGAYGSIGRIKARPGQRGMLADLILAGTTDMPGCISYIVAEDMGEADALWVFEVWASEAAHDASLRLPAVRDAIAKGRPLIAGFDSGAELRVVGGKR